MSLRELCASLATFLRSEANKTSLLHGRCIMTVIFVRRHRLLAALLPDAIVVPDLSQRFGHLANMNRDRTAAGAYVVDSYIASLQGIVAHIFASQLQRIKTQRE